MLKRLANSYPKLLANLEIMHIFGFEFAFASFSVKAVVEDSVAGDFIRF